jgi:hypothetical protein
MLSMRNPLSLFRRHQKILLAVFGVVIMITFTIGGSIDWYQGAQTRPGQDTGVVVTWKHGRFHDDDLYLMRTTHNLTVRFLDALVMRAVEAGGMPTAPGITRDPTTGQIRDPGIPRSYAEEDLVQTAILARRAEEMGVMVSDQAILEFLDGLAANKVPRSEFAGLLRDATGGRLIQQQLFEQLRTELRAQNLRMMANSGLFAITPVSAWNYFNRLNRRVSAEMLPLPVEDFVAKVSKEPTPAEIQSLYDDGKDRYPNPYRREPGFKRPLRIAFQYLKADFERFLEAEMAKVSDEQVQEYYEKNKQDFKAPELPPVDDLMPGDPEQTPAEPEGEPKPEDETTAPNGADDAMEETTPGDSAPPALEGPENQPETGDTPESPTPTPEPSSDDSSFVPGQKKGDRHWVFSRARAGTGLVCTLILRQRKNRPKTAGRPLNPSRAEASPAEDDEMSAEAGTSESAPAESGTSESAPAEPGTAEPATAEPGTAESAPATESAPAEPESTTEPEAAVRYKPLEEVADQIRRSIARPQAQDAMSEALKNARRDIDAYFRARVRAKALRDAKRDAPEPAPLDLEAMGEKYQLIPGETRMVDGMEISDFELGKAYRFSFAQGQVQTIPFAQIAYVEGIPLFRPDQIRSFDVDVEFLYWKAEEEEQFVPTLDQARDDVIAAWKREQALELAKAEAERLVKAARPDKSLRETVGEALAERVFDTGEFSWMTRGATPSGFGAPSLSQVPGVEGAGSRLYGERLPAAAGSSRCGSERVAKHGLRRATARPDSGRREATPGFPPLGGHVRHVPHGLLGARTAGQDWYEEIQQQYNVQWKRTPEMPRDDL